MPSKYKLASKCQNIVKFIPSITPEIYTLSVYTSQSGVYTVVTINGIKFSINGYTGYSTVNFGSFLNLPVVFFGSKTISFEVPTNAISGIYNVSVKNINYPATLYSNIVTYTIT